MQKAKVSKPEKRGAMRSPRGTVEIGPPRKPKTMVFFRELVAPGKTIVYLGPNPEMQSRDHIKKMYRDARRALIAEGGNPKQTAKIISDKEQQPDGADRAYFAAQLHEQLIRTKNCLRVLLACPAEDARWHGLNFANEMDTSRFYWQRLQLVESEKFIVAGEGLSKGGKKGNEGKQFAAQQKAKLVSAFFAEKGDIPRGQMKAVVSEASKKLGLKRSQIYAIKKVVRQRAVPD
jgi:hypothetical protein